MEENVIQDDSSGLNSLVQSKVIKLTKYKFTEEVEAIVWNDDITYLEAIAIVTERYNIEAEDAPKLITEELFHKLEDEAIDMSLLKSKQRKTKKLPF